MALRPSLAGWVAVVMSGCSLAFPVTDFLDATSTQAAGGDSTSSGAGGEAGGGAGATTGGGPAAGGAGGGVSDGGGPPGAGGTGGTNGAGGAGGEPIGAFVVLGGTRYFGDIAPSGQSSTAITAVISADVYADGSVGAWRDLEPMPFAFSSLLQAAWVDGSPGEVRVLGVNTSKPMLQRASFDPVSGLGAWSSSVGATVGTQSPSAWLFAMSDDRFFAFVSEKVDALSVQKLYRYDVASTPSLPNVLVEAALVEPRETAAVRVVGSRVVVIGGDIVGGGTTLRDTVEVGTIQVDGTLAFDGTTLPIVNGAGKFPVQSSATCVGGDVVYSVGGLTTSLTRTAKIVRGTVGPTSAGPFEVLASTDLTTNELSGPLSGTACVVVDSRLYVFGGIRAGNQVRSTVEWASLNPDGSVGPQWTVSGVTPLPFPLAGMLAVFVPR